MAIDLTTAQGHRQSFCHVSLYGAGHGRVLVGGTNPNLGARFVLELAGAQLGEFGARDEGEDDIAGESGFDVVLNSNGVGGIK